MKDGGAQVTQWLGVHLTFQADLCDGDGGSGGGEVRARVCARVLWFTFPTAFPVRNPDLLVGSPVKDSCQEAASSASATALTDAPVPVRMKLERDDFTRRCGCGLQGHRSGSWTTGWRVSVWPPEWIGNLCLGLCSDRNGF